MPISASKKEHLFSRINGCFFIINVAHTKTLVFSFLLDEKQQADLFAKYNCYILYYYIYLQNIIAIYIYNLQFTSIYLLPYIYLQNIIVIYIYNLQLTFSLVSL